MRPASQSLFSSFRGRGSDEHQEKREFWHRRLEGTSIVPLPSSASLSLISLPLPLSTHRVPCDSALAGRAGLAGVLGLLDRGLERGLGVSLDDDRGAEGAGRGGDAARGDGAGGGDGARGERGAGGEGKHGREKGGWRKKVGGSCGEAVSEFVSKRRTTKGKN